jgi:hypothetical protein
MEVGVPEPAVLDDFYGEIGFEGGDGVWGSSDLPGQIRITEAPYRQLREYRVGCEDEADLDATAKRLDAINVKYQTGEGRLRVPDPINKWEYVIEPAAAHDLPPKPARLLNKPGERNRVNERAEVLREATPRPPRRLGHIVCGTNDLPKSLELAKAVGFRTSDIVGGLAHFMRCSRDHHNFLLTPGPVPYLNHYALEYDDFDAVMRAASVYNRNHEEVQVDGPGRHQIGGNVFWYLKDPSGTFFEHFTDMDVIEDDDAWEIREDWDLADSWSVFGSGHQSELFFNPGDMQEVIAGFNKANA